MADTDNDHWTVRKTSYPHESGDWQVISPFGVTIITCLSQEKARRLAAHLNKTGFRMIVSAQQSIETSLTEISGMRDIPYYTSRIVKNLHEAGFKIVPIDGET